MVASLAEVVLSRGVVFPHRGPTAASACPCLVLIFGDVPKQRTTLKGQALTRLTFLSCKLWWFLRLIKRRCIKKDRLNRAAGSSFLRGHPGNEGHVCHHPS